MDKSNYAVNLTTVNSLFTEVNRKYPNFLDDEVRKNLLDKLVEITAGEKTEVSFIKKEKLGQRYVRWEFAFKVTIYHEIELNLYKLHAETGERRMLAKRLFVIKPQASVKDAIVDYINAQLQKGRYTISVHAVLIKNYSSLDQSLRDKIKQYHYDDDTGSLFLYFPNDVTMIFPAKGVIMIHVIINFPQRTEFKVTQKFLPTIHHVIQHHINEEGPL